MFPAARTIPVDTTTTSKVLAAGLTLVRFWSFRETTGGAPAVFELFDGSGPNGALIASISLSQGESTRDPLPNSGCAAFAGLYLDVISGSIRGAVWTSQATLDNGFAYAAGALPVWSGNES